MTNLKDLGLGLSLSGLLAQLILLAAQIFDTMAQKIRLSFGLLLGEKEGERR